MRDFWEEARGRRREALDGSIWNSEKLSIFPASNSKVLGEEMAPAVGRIPSPSAIHVEVKSDGET
jgi:hypothetical protein